MGSYQLRGYQEDAVNAGIKNFQNYPNPFVIVIPTGGGKSLCIAELCHRLNEPILVLQPTKEILEQNYAKLLSYGITDVGIYSASIEEKSNIPTKRRTKAQMAARSAEQIERDKQAGSRDIRKFTYATIGSIYKKPELFRHFKKVIIDECHVLSPKNIMGMYNTFFRDIDCRSICGLTATPYRLTQRFYKKDEELYYTATLSMINRIHPFFFKKLAYKIDIQTLLAQGYLCPLEYKNYEDFDVSNIKINTTGADYDEDALERFWNDKRIKKLSNIIAEIDNVCKFNLIFCGSIKQATNVTTMLRDRGLSADFVTSTHRPKERDEIISKFRNGKTKHLANVGVLTMGFDFPELDGITLARPTISLGLLYQMIGRGMRPARGKQTCRVFDITENINKLGRIETIRLAKEDNGFKDIVVTEKGEITGKPLFTFKMKNEEKKERIIANIEKAKPNLTEKANELSLFDGQ